MTPTFPFEGPPAGEASTEQILEAFPDLVADALLKWRTASEERKRAEAHLYLTLKAKTAETRPTVEVLKAMVRADAEIHRLCLEEVKAESDYIRLYEKLMAAKRQAAMRAAF